MMIYNLRGIQGFALALQLVLLLSMMTATTTANRADARKVRFMNQSGAKVDVYWINRWQNDERVMNSEGFLTGAETMINSFVGHEFEVVELPSKKTKVCAGPNEECRTAIFQVNVNDDQLVIIKEGLELEHQDNKSRARDEAAQMIQECKEEAAAARDLSAKEQLQQLTTCMNSSLNVSLSKKTEEMDFQSTLRKDMGTKLEAYACNDPNMTTTESTENSTYSFETARNLPVRVLFDRPASQIHLIERFITTDECRAIENAIKVERVDGVNGLYASKGGVNIPLDDIKGLLSGVVRRMYNYATTELGTILEPTADSESVFAIHYNGSEDSPDKYEAHCDGPCEGEKHVAGDRIATFIMYCEMPETGGATHFPNAGVHVQPKKGDAVFLGYFDPIHSITDEGFTKHAGCSVREGTKKIITHKIRSQK